MDCLGFARRTHRRGPVVTCRRAIVAGCCLATAWRCGLPGGEASAFVSANGPRSHFSAVTGQHSKVPRTFSDSPSQPLEDVVIKEDYKLAGIFGVLGAVLFTLLPLAGAFILLLGVLFFVQAGRVRFVFNRETFELRTLGEEGDLQDSGEK